MHVVPCPGIKLFNNTRVRNLQNQIVKATLNNNMITVYKL